MGQVKIGGGFKRLGDCLNRDLLDWKIFRIADCGEKGKGGWEEGPGRFFNKFDAPFGIFLKTVAHFISQISTILSVFKAIGISA